jgi:hypothetical protein
LGEAIHGWLPIHIKIDAKKIKIDASDVPNNPVQEFITALSYATKNQKASVWCNIEPDGYFFEFLPISNDVELRILFSSNSETKNQSEIAKIYGNKKEILLPIWREIRKFESLSFKEPHWPHVDFRSLQEIRESLT